MRVLAENIIAAIENARMAISHSWGEEKITRENNLACADAMLSTIVYMLKPEPKEIQFTPIPQPIEPTETEKKQKQYIDTFSEYVNGAEE